MLLSGKVWITIISITSDPNCCVNRTHPGFIVGEWTRHKIDRISQMRNFTNDFAKINVESCLSIREVKFAGKGLMIKCLKII